MALYRILVGFAEVKELGNIPHLREAPNRLGKEREKSNPCPKENIPSIKDALQHVKMI